MTGGPHINWDSTAKLGAQFGLPGLAFVLIIFLIIAILIRPNLVKNQYTVTILIVGLLIILGLSLYLGSINSNSKSEQSSISHSVPERELQCQSKIKSLSEDIKYCRQKLADISENLIGPDCPFPKKSSIRAFMSDVTHSGYIDLGEIWIKCPAYKPGYFHAYTEIGYENQVYTLKAIGQAQGKMLVRVPMLGAVTYQMSPNGPWEDAKFDVKPIKP